jgi:hypothetical protein
MFLRRAFGSFWVGSAVALSVFGVATAFAADQVPDCPAFALKSQNGGDPGSLEVNNDQVIEWKRTTDNQYHDRGHVKGQIVQVYPDKNGHEHFAIQIGPGKEDTLEIIYNQDFGSVPDPQVGMDVEACGDYITSTAPAPGPGNVTYPASPDSAILHWVHMAPQRSGHNSGFLWIDGVLTGQDPGHAPPKPKRPKHPKHPHDEVTAVR